MNENPQRAKNVEGQVPNTTYPISDVRRWRKPGSVWDHGEGKHFSIEDNKRLEDIEVEGSDEETKKKNGTFQDTKPLIHEVPTLLPEETEKERDEKIKSLLEARSLFTIVRFSSHVISSTKRWIRIESA